MPGNPPSSKPVVAIFRNVFLPYSETFIYDSLQSYASFRPIVFTKKRANEHLFSFEPVYIPNSLSRLGRIEHFFFSTGILSTPAVSQKFLKHQPKIIHAHFGQSGVLAIPYAKKFNIPLIVSLHGNDVGILLGRQKFMPKWWWYTLSFRRLVKHTTLFLTASVDLSTHLQDLGCPATKIRLHRLGIDLRKFRVAQEPQKSPTIFMIGRLVEKKGFAYGIRAFAAALERLDHEVRSRITLCIVGTGPLENRLKQVAQKLNISERVQFLGAQPHEQILKYLQKQATVLLCPSIVTSSKDRDSGIIVAKEASACGIPVIGSQHGGLPEIIEDQVTGYLAAEKDVAAMAASLSKILANPELQQKMGAAARLKMEKEYDIKQRMQELETIYFDMIQQGKGGQKD